MPLNFTENEKPREPVEFFIVNTKARPLDLEGEVLPELIRRCGDVKSGCITAEMVEAYLDKHVLIFDRALIKSLFQEADYRKQGMLDTRALTAALSARYPKRQLHREWRQLAALLLSTPELVLSSDTKSPKYFDGALNNECIWDSPPKELPKAPRRRKPKTKKQPGDWQATTQALQTQGSQTQGPSSATIRTADGVRTLTSLTAAEHRLNGLSLESSARCTFEAQKEFERLQKSQELEAAFGAAATAAAAAAGALTQDSVMRGPGKRSVRSWTSTMPPSAITMPSSALGTLRTAVRSTMATKPEFIQRTPQLTCAETDAKKILGQPLDVTLALNRVEPVRPTKILPGASFRDWGDYATRGCRTAPSAWFNEHPAAPAPPSEHRWC